MTKELYTNDSNLNSVIIWRLNKQWFQYWLYWQGLTSQNFYVYLHLNLKQCSIFNCQLTLLVCCNTRYSASLAPKYHDIVSCFALTWTYDHLQNIIRGNTKTISWHSCYMPFLFLLLCIHVSSSHIKVITLCKNGISS